MLDSEYLFIENVVFLFSKTNFDLFISKCSEFVWISAAIGGVLHLFFLEETFHVKLKTALWIIKAPW